TAFLCFFATGVLLGVFRLFIDEGITAIIVAFEIIGGGFTAKVAVDALVIDVIFAAGVFRVPVSRVSHKSSVIGVNMEFENERGKAENRWSAPINLNLAASCDALPPCYCFPVLNHHSSGMANLFNGCEMR